VWEVKSWHGGVFGARAVTGDDNGAFVFFFEDLLFATSNEMSYIMLWMVIIIWLDDREKRGVYWDKVCV